MNTLMIKDLSITEQLDSKAMSAVRGGTGYYPSSSYFNFMPVYAPNNSKTVDATQLINTTMNIQNANGNNAAFVCGHLVHDRPARERQQQHQRALNGAGRRGGTTASADSYRPLLKKISQPIVLFTRPPVSPPDSRADLLASLRW